MNASRRSSTWTDRAGSARDSHPIHRFDRQGRGMTLDRRARAHRRASAHQLRADLTTMIAVAGLVATAGFGWLASLTYAGSPATSTTGTVSDNPGTVATPTPANHQ